MGVWEHSLAHPSLSTWQKQGDRCHRTRCLLPYPHQINSMVSDLHLQPLSDFRVFTCEGTKHWSGAFADNS